MALSWYTQSGTPADTVGVDGDMSFDYSQRIQWGPKGRISAGSWLGTQVNAVGPTGPGVLSGTGQPSSSLGSTGNVYVDAATGDLYLKGASSWSKTGTLPAGAPGPQGFTSVQNFAPSLGRNAYANSITSTSTPTTLTEVNATFPIVFQPQQASALTGVAIGNNGSGQFTVSLVNQSTSAVIWSGTTSNGTGSVYFNYTATQYPLSAGVNYIWQVSGAGTANFVVQPFYMMPSGQTNVGTGVQGGFTSPTGTTISSTVQYFGVGQKMLASASAVRTFATTRAGQILSAQATYIPSTAGAATATATFTIYYYVTASQTGGTVTTFTCTNNSAATTTVFATPPSTTANTVYYMGVTGTGTGQLDAQLNVIV